MITQLGLKASSAEMIPAYSVIMTSRATIGECAINKVSVSTNQGFKNFVPFAMTDVDFLYYLLGTQKQGFIHLCGGSTFLEIGKSQLAAYEVRLPSTKSEQRAIATALSDVDALLDGLDRLIAKKRNLKQAAMQQLLTGETRLPGFEGEWEAKKLGDMGVFLKGSGVRKDEAQSGDLPCIRYGEIYTHHNDYVLSYNSWISPSVASTAIHLKKGDILFAGSGETKDEIGKCVAFIDDCEAYAGGDIVILRPYEADPIFMGYYCNTTPVRKQKASRGQGDAVVHISAAALSSVEVHVPSLPEQTAIATVLSDMDAEIAVLEHRRNKTKNIKQAMMQELLTGKTRLVTPGGSNV